MDGNMTDKTPKRKFVRKSDKTEDIPISEKMSEAPAPDMIQIEKSARRSRGRPKGS